MLRDMEVEIDKRNETLVSLFLSGKSHQRFGASSSAAVPSHVPLAGENLAFLTDWAGAEFDYFPEPPCIGENEGDEEEQGATSDVRATWGTSAQAYWKSQVSLQPKNAAQKADADKADAFITLWFREAGGAAADAGWERGVSTERVEKIKPERRARNSFSDGDHLEAYVNISLCKVGIRSCASSDESFRTAETVDPGEAVVINKAVEDDGTRFFKLADDRGWVFDYKDDLHVLARMEELEVGLSWYRVVCPEMVGIRRCPVYDTAAKSDSFLSPRELFVVNIRAKVCGHFFVHLADGRGWVFMSKYQDKRKDKKALARGTRTGSDDGGLVVEECEGEIVEGNLESDKVNIPPTSAAVEVGTWTYQVGYDAVLAFGTQPHGVYVCPGDVIVVNKRCYYNGDAPTDPESARLWLRLADDRGWIPEKSINGQLLVTLRKDGEVTYPQHYKAKWAQDNVQSWEIGVA